MKKTVSILRTDLQPGDVTITAHVGNPWIEVEREVPDPPKPVGPLPGTRGTAIVWGTRTHGMIDEDGDFRYLEYDSYGGEVISEYTTTKDFVPDSDEKPEPAKPQITREKFIETLNKTVSDNDLHVGGDFERAIVFAADRLGLR